MSSIEEIFNNSIGYNDRIIVKNELLTDVEVLNRYQKNGIIDLLYCRLLINMFDFQLMHYSNWLLLYIMFYIVLH